MRKKILSILFFVSFAALWGIAGGVEQDYITIGQAVSYLVLDTVIIAVSGFGGGLLVGQNDVHKLMINETKTTKRKRA